MPNKTTLILDMYGVILKERTGNFVPYVYEHFDNSEHERLNKLFNEERLFTKAGYGKLTSNEFLSLLGFKNPEFHMKNYIENYLSIDEEFYTFAERTFERFDLILLSTDVSEWSAYIMKHYGLDKYFKHKIVSGDVGMRKPDPKIYELTLNKIGKSAEECMFIDDSIPNITAAKELGIDSVLFNRFNENYIGEQVCSFKDLLKTCFDEALI